MEKCKLLLSVFLLLSAYLGNAQSKNMDDVMVITSFFELLKQDTLSEADFTEFISAEKIGKPGELLVKLKAFKSAVENEVGNLQDWPVHPKLTDVPDQGYGKTYAIRLSESKEVKLSLKSERLYSLMLYDEPEWHIDTYF